MLVQCPCGLVLPVTRRITLCRRNALPQPDDHLFVRLALDGVDLVSQTSEGIGHLLTPQGGVSGHLHGTDDTVIPTGEVGLQMTGQVVVVDAPVLRLIGGVTG